MATKTIMWGDGTSDQITVTYSGAVGHSDLIVASNHNSTFSTRKKTIQLKINGATMGTISVTQKPGTRGYSVAYSPAYK